jgi:ProP effector
MTTKIEKQAAIHWLIDQFPNAFFQKSHLVRPLKLGVLDDIFEIYARLDEPPFSKKLLREALNYYTSSKAYLMSQKLDAVRVDLFGQPIGVVNAEQANYAQQRFQERYARQTIK